MKKVLSHKKHFLLILLLPFFSCCASIVSRSNWPYYVESDPPGANISIVNKKGREIFKGKTPTLVHLRSGAGFFSRESYTITYLRRGFEEKKVNVECKINGWYFGNLLFGAAIGMLIIDPATGAMYKLDGKGSHEVLIPIETTQTRSLKIIDIQQVPENLQEKLVLLH